MSRVACLRLVIRLIDFAARVICLIIGHRAILGLRIGTGISSGIFKFGANKSANIQASDVAFWAMGQSTRIRTALSSRREDSEWSIVALARNHIWGLTNGFFPIRTITGCALYASIVNFFIFG